MTVTNTHYFGIRHHGPGSANRLIAALNALKPAQVLIEGPSDCSELLPLLAQQKMQPPVALLGYSADQPACSIYYPFAEFSPEYQACLWAVKNEATVAFIDIPVAIQLAQWMQAIEARQAADEGADNEPENTETIHIQEPSQLVSDPIGILAELSGYEDGEAWWNDLIEQNRDSTTDIFSTVEMAIGSLRERLDDTDPIATRDSAREAFMRLEISNAQKRAAANSNIAVVCGAWHVPALRQKHPVKADKEIVKALPAKLSKTKVKTTWIPWTSPRLSARSGYGAGVAAPMWYQHLWDHRQSHCALELWLAKVSQYLRQNGQVVSTASVIEAVRLSKSLAIVRNRPDPGFEEIRESAIACLCFGERLVWTQIEEKLLLGNQVGSIPDNIPLVPLLEDLQRQQLKNKLKPEALERELALDLRSDSGLGKSILLHRLGILAIPWGRLADAGSSRGTFREKWVLCWQPEYAVKLVENLVYGSTIEQAANNKISEVIHKEKHLAKLAEAIQLCLESQLHQAADLGLAQLNERAAHTSDAIELLDSLSPLINIHRYGTAREISLAHINSLVERLSIQAALALPYACRNLNDEESLHYRHSVNSAHQALQLAEINDTIMESWWSALRQIVENAQSSLQLAGLCARMLYQAQKMDADELQSLLQKALSAALPAADAARFFEGFFAESVQRLLYDNVLLEAVENWLLQLDEQVFIEFLPLFRRVFSSLDGMERKRLMDAVLGTRSHSQLLKTVNSELLSSWMDQLAQLERLFQRDKSWTQ